MIVVDGTWTLVQSGNYSDASIPKSETDGGDPNHFVKGNRDMGVAIKSEALAAFFTQVLRSDMKLELDASAVGLVEEEVLPGEEQPPGRFLDTTQPPKLPPRLFSSKLFRPQKAAEVILMLSPDNYMDVIPDFIGSAAESIYIEQQYIRAYQPEVQRLLSSVRTAMHRNPDLDVRIVLAWPYKPRSDSEIESIQTLEEFGLKLGTHVRFLNERYFVHCHNKLVIVDREAALVSSQNWSDFAVTKNREAGVLLYYPQMARYNATVYNLDWRTGRKTFVKESKPEVAGGLEAVGARVPVTLGDYIEV